MRPRPPFKGRVGTTVGAMVRTTFTSLRTRNFRLFFIGQTVSNTGNWLTNLALTLLVLHLTNSGLAIGLLAAAQYGPILLFSINAGVIADRHNKRNLLFVTQSLEMAESVVLACLAFMHHPPLIALFATAAVGGSLLALDNPLRRSFVTEMVPEEDRSNAVVLYSLVVNVSRIFGPALAGVLVITVGYGWCFSIDAASYLVVLVALWMMRPAELRRGVAPPRAKGEIRAGLRYVAQAPNLWISFVMLAVIGLLSYNYFSVTLPLFAIRSLHGGDGTFTLLYSTFSFGAVVSALVIANKRLVHLHYIVIGAATFGVTMLGLALAPNTGVAVPAMFLVGLTSILYMTSTTAIIQVEADPAFHGRILALQTFLLIGTAPIGGPILGWLADAFGARTPILLGGLVCLVAAVFGVAASRRLKRRPMTITTPLGTRGDGALAQIASAGPTEGFDGGDVVGEAGRHFQGQVEGVEVGVGPGLRQPPPAAAAEERRRHRIVADHRAPLRLGDEKAGDNCVVLRLLRVLGVKPDLEARHGGTLDVFAADDLRLVVLPGWRLVVEPDLDAGAVGPIAELAQVARHEPAERVGDLVEQGQVHGATSMVDGATPESVVRSVPIPPARPRPGRTGENRSPPAEPANAAPFPTPGL